MKFCPKCGVSVSDASRFCSACGANVPAGGPPAGQAAAAPAPFLPTEAPTSGKAIASMVLGVCSFLFSILTGVPAIVLGHMAKTEIQKSGGRLRGDGFAMAGLILGYISLASIPLVLIIAAVAIPNLIRAKIAANEASAVYTLREVTRSALTYSTIYGNGYPANLGTLGGPTGMTATCDNAMLITGEISNSGVDNTVRRFGYTFTYVPGTQVATAPAGCNNPGVNSFSLYAVPVKVGKTGQRGFMTDSSGAIHVTTDGSIPTALSPSLQ